MTIGGNTAAFTQQNGGRVLLLFLLFLLSLYSFYTSGFSAFAMVCAIPVLVLGVIAAFRYRMLMFWTLMIVNYSLQLKNLSLPLPMSIPNEMLEIVLLVLAIIDVKESRFERTANLMMFALIIWCSFCMLEVLNDTCHIGINVGAWYTGARMMAFQLMYAFLVFTLYITSPKILMQYLKVWACLSLIAVFWAWKQKNFGFTHAEDIWVHTRGATTHILQGGTLIRYFSVYSDAANYGIAIASTGVAFVIFGITMRLKRYKYFFLLTGVLCIWGMFPSGTRTATFCMIAGFLVYIFLSKSFKIAIPFTAFFAVAVCLLAFTTIGNGNQQIRRMRSAFNKDDASANQRTINQQTMKKYMAEAPWGIGLGMGNENVPANNKFRLMATIAPDSEYVFIWLRTGAIGIITFICTMLMMLAGACWIVFFKIKNPSLRGIGAGLCCAFVSQQLGGYGNQVLMQFPNCLIFYGGLTIVYVLPHIEEEWNQYESRKLEEQAERARLRLEKKRAKRV
jgi:hypothetical protein